MSTNIQVIQSLINYFSGKDELYSMLYKHINEMDKAFSTPSSLQDIIFEFSSWEEWFLSKNSETLKDSSWVLELVKFGYTVAQREDTTFDKVYMEFCLNSIQNTEVNDFFKCELWRVLKEEKSYSQNSMITGLLILSENFDSKVFHEYQKHILAPISSTDTLKVRLKHLEVALVILDEFPNPKLLKKFQELIQKFLRPIFAQEHVLEELILPISDTLFEATLADSENEFKKWIVLILEKKENISPQYLIALGMLYRKIAIINHLQGEVRTTFRILEDSVKSFSESNASTPLPSKYFEVFIDTLTLLSSLYLHTESPKKSIHCNDLLISYLKESKESQITDKTALFYEVISLNMNATAHAVLDENSEAIRILEKAISMCKQGLRDGIWEDKELLFRFYDEKISNLDLLGMREEALKEIEVSLNEIKLYIEEEPVQKYLSSQFLMRKAKLFDDQGMDAEFLAVLLILKDLYSQMTEFEDDEDFQFRRDWVLEQIANF